tara:strand:- start:367 stop:585 length:219 start_codon:yes stop_codon:yes gene_type:complete
MMDNNQDNKKIEEAKASDVADAYQTLVEWVKTVPDAIAHIKKNGNKEDLLKYQQHIKLVIDKMKDIEKKLNQ